MRNGTYGVGRTEVSARGRTLVADPRMPAQRPPSWVIKCSPTAPPRDGQGPHPPLRRSCANSELWTGGAGRSRSGRWSRDVHGTRAGGSGPTVCPGRRHPARRPRAASTSAVDDRRGARHHRDRRGRLTSWGDVDDAPHSRLVVAGLVARVRIRTGAAEAVREVVDVKRLDLAGLHDDLAINLVQGDAVSRPNLKLVGRGRADIREDEEDGLALRDRDLRR